MTNAEFKKAQMDPSAVYRIMMQARQARSESILHWTVVFFHYITFGAAVLSASVRSAFATRRLSRAALHISFAPMSKSKGSIR